MLCVLCCVPQTMWYQIELLANKTGAKIVAPAASNCPNNCITASPFEWWVGPLCKSWSQFLPWFL